MMRKSLQSRVPHAQALSNNVVPAPIEASLWLALDNC